MTTQEKFTAAINVIRSLPKNGAYQPSKDLLLRFYAYYKQATVGPNNQPKPSFWDVVNRAKWQAWEQLGDMPKEIAMQEYVNELKKIVETMAYTNPVADFVSSLDSFYESVSIDDLEMVVGPIDRGSLLDKSNSTKMSMTEHLSTVDTDIEDECFHDVMESSAAQQINHYLISSDYVEHSMPIPHIPVYEQNVCSVAELPYPNELLDEFQLQVRNTISAMRYDLDVITNKVAQIEQKFNEIKTREYKPHRVVKQNRYNTIFLIGWPIVVQLLFIWFRRLNRRKTINA